MILRRVPRRTYEIFYTLEVNVNVIAVSRTFQRARGRDWGRREFLRIPKLNFRVVH